METGARSTRRDAEDLRDLARCVPLVVMQDEDRPLIGRKTLEATFQLVAIGQRQQLIGRGRSVDGQDAEIGHATTLAGRVIDAFTDDDASEPGVETVRIAEPAQVSPGDHQRILQGILGPIDVAKDPLCEREQGVDARMHQVDECRPIASLRRTDQVAIHVLVPRWHTSGVPVHALWPREAPQRSKTGGRAQYPRAPSPVVDVGREGRL